MHFSLVLFQSIYYGYKIIKFTQFDRITTILSFFVKVKQINFSSKLAFEQGHNDFVYSNLNKIKKRKKLIFVLEETKKLFELKSKIYIFMFA